MLLQNGLSVLLQCEIGFCNLFIPRHTKYAEGVYSFRQFRPSVPSVLLSICPSVIQSVNPFYNQVLLQFFDYL